MQINSFSPNVSPLHQCLGTKKESEQTPQKQTPSRNAVETSGTVGMTPAEMLGRTQVNFCANKDSETKLTPADANFVKGIAKVFRLNEEQEKRAEQILKDFLKESNFKKLSDMQSNDPVEFANEEGWLIETLTNEFDLTDYENTVLTQLEIEQVEAGDITKTRPGFRTNPVEQNKYARDYTPLKNLLAKQYNKDSNVIQNIYDYLVTGAYMCNCDSIYDLFDKEHKSMSMNIIENMSGKEFGNLNQAQKTDLLLDLVKLSGKTSEERLEGINRREQMEKFEDFTGTIAIANRISEEYDIEITEKLIDLLDERKTSTELHKDNKPSIEVAYNIAETYKLPKGSVRKIAQIIDDYENKDRKGKFNDLLDAIKKEPLDKEY